ncbi:MAG: 50S ribosomal protein L35 [Patescibacteria group bacterium]
MPKLKTRKTLLKRIKITKKGKFMKKLVGMGHLKVKTTVDRKARKSKLSEQMNAGHKRKFRKLLAKHSRGI